jgi:3D-(3,5/4)-trihydroxycyclohexane-1,2-dione acylhydrolase (decyclizing)
VHVEVGRFAEGLDNEGWWDVPVAEGSDRPEVVAARERYERARRAQRSYLQTP